MTKTMLVACVVIASSGCMMGPAPNSAPARRQRPVVTAENRLVLMPYGQYKGKAERGTATLDLRDDQRFVLHWQARLPGGRVREGQWNGTFEWLKNAAGMESLAFFDVREAVDARILDGTKDDSQVVTHLDKELHRFAIRVPDLGTVDFEPAGGSAP